MKLPGDKAEEHSERPQADALLEMYGAAEGPASCALLTPAIQARLRGMAAGQVLEVRVDDPSARADIASWCRLTRNELLAVVSEESVTHYYLRKRQG